MTGVSLPRRLSATTLGDLLGSLHRARVTGTLELTEVRGVTAGRAHKVHLREGLVVGVDAASDACAPEDHGGFGGPTLRRLEALFALDDAELCFRVAQRRSEVTELGPSAFLSGRARARDRRPDASDAAPAERARALSMLGLDLGATAAEVHEAWKRLALRFHPDRHAGAPAAEKKALSLRLVELTQAYQTLRA